MGRSTSSEKRSHCNTNSGTKKEDYLYRKCILGLVFSHTLSLQVNYVGKAGNMYSTGYELDGSAYVISKHISNTWLWDRVRVSGGAYGGFCDFDSHSGLKTSFNFSSLNVFKELS